MVCRPMPTGTVSPSRSRRVLSYNSPTFESQTTNPTAIAKLLYPDLSILYAEMSNRLWVNNEYINELTVFLGFCIALIPWNIQLVSISDIGRMVFVRFPFFQIRYQLGFELGEQNLILTPLGAYNYQAGNPMADPYLWWVAAATPLAIAVLLACTMYTLDHNATPGTLDALQNHARIPLARIMGGLMAIGTVALIGSTYLLATTGFQGINIPVGILFTAIFAWILLTNPVVETTA